MPTTLARLLTVGEIARRAGCDLHRVKYFILSRGIRPVGMAGNARVFSESDAERIVEELRQSDAGSVKEATPTE